MSKLAHAAAREDHEMVGITFEREQIEKAGGEIHIHANETFTISFPAMRVDVSGLVNAFEDNGFTMDEAYSAVNHAVGQRNWRRLGQLAKIID